jgi:hypothetical protein
MLSQIKTKKENKKGLKMPLNQLLIKISLAMIIGTLMYFFSM